VPARWSGVVGKPPRSWSSGEPPGYLLQRRGRSSPSTSQPSPRPPMQAPAPASSPAPAPGRGQVRRTWRPGMRAWQPIAGAASPMSRLQLAHAPRLARPLAMVALPALDPRSSMAPRRAWRGGRPAWRRASMAARPRASRPVPAHCEDGRRRFCSGEPAWVGADSSPVEPHGAVCSG
jgi:hypothetical protein